MSVVVTRGVYLNGAFPFLSIYFRNVEVTNILLGSHFLCSKIVLDYYSHVNFGSSKPVNGIFSPMLDDHMFYIN